MNELVKVSPLAQSFACTYSIDDSLWQQLKIQVVYLVIMYRYYYIWIQMNL